MTTPGLAALLGPNSVTEFLAESWPHEPFEVHGLTNEVDALTSIPFLKSLEEMAAQWPGQVQVHLPDVKDESSAIDARPLEAMKLFANKMALLFNNVHTQSPVLQEWLLAIAKDLGLPNSTYARCMVYATPDGKGTAPHFDQNINFVLQLHGTKTWWLAPNMSVENPTERFTMGQPIDPELASYAYEAMPTEMPEPQRKVVLNPGSMLFVPRGYWHRTEAEGEALALNFTFNQPTWIDLFTLALKSRLLLSPDWRELADGAGARDSVTRAKAAGRFNSLLADLIEDLPNWRADDILAATEGWD